MREEIDWCAMINDIEKNPKKIRKGLKVKHLGMIKAHLRICKSCDKTVDRINAQNIREPEIFTEN